MPIPRLGKWDSRRDLLADPYRFIGRTCIDLGSDVFATRLQTALFDGAASGLLPHLGARIARKQGVLSIAMDRLPAIPRDGFVIEQVRAA